MKVKVIFEEEIEIEDLPNEFFKEMSCEITANLHSDGDISIWICDHVDYAASVNIKELVTIALNCCIKEELRETLIDCITVIDNHKET